MRLLDMNFMLLLWMLMPSEIMDGLMRPSQAGEIMDMIEKYWCFGFVKMGAHSVYRELQTDAYSKGLGMAYFNYRLKRMVD